MNSLILNPGREKSLQHRHPWIFTGAVDRIKGEPQSGETVAVRDTHGAFLALAAYSPKSQILGRVWTYRENETVDEVFLRARLARAIGLRQELAKTTFRAPLFRAASKTLSVPRSLISKLSTGFSTLLGTETMAA